MSGKGEGLERMIRQLVGKPLAIGLATVVGPVPNPFNPLLSPLVSVLLQPGSVPAEMRLLQVGHGPGQGLHFPVLPGAEVLVLYPDGDPDAGVALAGLSSGANVAPLPTDGSGAILMALAGVTLRSASGLPSSAIVKGDLFADLSTWVAAAEAFMFATSTATTALQIQAAAVVFMSAVGQVGAAPSPFSAALALSGALPGGAPPYASLLNKVTD